VGRENLSLAPEASRDGSGTPLIRRYMACLERDGRAVWTRRDRLCTVTVLLFEDLPNEFGLEYV
jgi:hypothetical protein